MLCSSIYSNLLNKIMQFVRTMSEGTGPTPPWRNNNHANHTMPPWKSEDGDTDTVSGTQQQTDGQRQYGDWDTPPSTVPPALWMEDESHRGTHRVVRGSADFVADTNESETNYESETDHHASDHLYAHGSHARRANYSNYYSGPMPEQSDPPTTRRSVRMPSSKKNLKPGDLNEEDETYESEVRKVEKRSQQTSNKSHKAKTISSSGISTGEVRRSWPEPREKGERRIIAANYSAVEIHGFFGLIDDGSVGEGRMLIVHVPKWIRGYFLDIKQGDTLHVYHANGGKIGGALTVLSTGRHKYYAPGRRVMTCTVCVPEEQWAPFTPYT